MKICIPVTRDLGLDSPVSSHFGSAPLFAVCDLSAGTVRVLGNGHAHHEHGACRPLDGLAGEQLDAALVGGIGAGALAKLRAAGIRVFRAPAPTVGSCLTALAQGPVEELGPGGACGGHGHHHDHDHDHGHEHGERPAPVPLPVVR